MRDLAVMDLVGKRQERKVFEHMTGERVLQVKDES